MVLIRDVVQQAITISYLTFLLPCHIQGGRGRPPHKKILDILLLGSLLEDLNAFMTLQEAAIAGLVRQDRDKRNQQLDDEELFLKAHLVIAGS